MLCRLLVSVLLASVNDYCFIKLKKLTLTPPILWGLACCHGSTINCYLFAPWSINVIYYVPFFSSRISDYISPNFRWCATLRTTLTTILFMTLQWSLMHGSYIVVVFWGTVVYLSWGMVSMLSSENFHMKCLKPQVSDETINRPLPLIMNQEHFQLCP